MLSPDLRSESENESKQTLYQSRNRKKQSRSECLYQMSECLYHSMSTMRIDLLGIRAAEVNAVAIEIGVAMFPYYTSLTPKPI